ncbi:MAG: glycosyltransferase [Candidatus Abyssobacteria bacterium SURF_17]|uniref:Glycosyltransferase n=1 Tax=Candidatus Abyssobacteria bacterium SURF_17 TaxID=2093361 RepID=A0A419F6T4_9BACT|nr:MAG: glycosyltransferase [Candidatus Abyssubacteria bacterium SURF_17]
MASVILTICLVSLCVAVGEYVLYNLLVMLAALLRSSRPETNFTPPLTIVIPAHNEEKHIRRKLESVLQSDYPRELINVIVVDDGSTDDTARQVREVAGDRVALIQTGERKGKIFAQKLAFSQASTEILAITDATVLTEPDAFRKLARHMADPQVGAVSASVMVRNRGTNYLTRISQFLFDIQNAQKLGESLLDSAAGPFGQLSLIRRAAVGDFSTEVIYEDREFGIILRKRGFRTILAPEVVATYHAPESFEDFSRQKQRNIGAMMQSVVRHRGLLYNLRYGWYGLLIFPEYSLFRILRVYLLMIAFLAAFVYCAAFERGFAVSLLSSMVGVVFFGYVIGTALLAPIVSERWRFLRDILISVPAMALVATHFAVASLKYFRGDFSSLWERVKRDRAV